MATLIAFALFLLSACRTAPEDRHSGQPAQAEAPAAQVPDTTRLRAIYNALDQDYERLMARYGEVSAQMSPEEQRLYRSMQQMHGQAAQMHEQMMTGGMMGRGMMGRGMMEHGMMDMHRLREWDQQMMAMHGQMASALRQQGFEDMAAMHEQMMQGYSQALDATAEAAGSSEAPPVREGGAVDGAVLFSQTCASCHGSEGRGVAGVFPPLAGSAWVTGDKDVPIRIVLNGLRGPIEVQGAAFDGLMPAFRARLSDEELAAILTYLRTSWGNQAPATSAADVRSVREATRDRSGPWSPSEVR